MQSYQNHRQHKAKQRWREQLAQRLLEINLGFFHTVMLNQPNTQRPKESRIGHVIDQYVWNRTRAKQSQVDRQPNKNRIGIKKHRTEQTNVALFDGQCSSNGKRQCKQDQHR